MTTPEKMLLLYIAIGFVFAIRAVWVLNKETKNGNMTAEIATIGTPYLIVLAITLGFIVWPLTLISKAFNLRPKIEAWSKGSK